MSAYFLKSAQFDLKFYPEEFSDKIFLDPLLLRNNLRTKKYPIEPTGALPGWQDSQPTTNPGQPGQPHGTRRCSREIFQIS